MISRVVLFQVGHHGLQFFEGILIIWKTQKFAGLLFIDEFSLESDATVGYSFAGIVNNLLLEGSFVLLGNVKLHSLIPILLDFSHVFRTSIWLPAQLVDKFLVASISFFLGGLISFAVFHSSSSATNASIASLIGLETLHRRSFHFFYFYFWKRKRPLVDEGALDEEGFGWTQVSWVEGEVMICQGRMESEWGLKWEMKGFS